MQCSLPNLAFTSATLAILLIGVARAADEPATSGAYKAWELVEKREFTRLKAIVDEIRIKQTTVTEDQTKIIAEYYEKAALARWTQTEGAKTVDPVKGYRQELRTEIRGSKGGVHDAINAVLLKLLQKMAADPECLPAARVNAMLAIGELNTTEPGGAGGTAMPYDAAIAVMLAELTAAKQIDGVRVEALNGLLRHAKAKAIKPDNPNLPAIVAACLALVGQTPPAERSAEGHGWLRSQAAELLGELGSPGANGQIATALANLAGESGASFIARREAVRALAKLDYSEAGANIAGAMVAALAKYTVDACAAEDGKYSKRRIKQRVTVARDSLEALKPAVGNAAAALEPVLKALLEVIDKEREETVMPRGFDEARAKLQPLAK